MRIHRIGTLAAAGSTGTPTNAGVTIPSDADAVILEHRITAVGATPTMTWKYQGSDDDGSLSDALSDWYDLEVMPSTAAAEAVSQTQTAVGVYESTLELVRRPTSKIRLVVTANTNCTFDGEARMAESATN